ncbi:MULTISPECIES: LysM peptidoglycan-binding domain-containing protein [unclassified Lysobacter]|uniref:LysM peptidoglycan-binding domain-containing protein n=1 Tax=unclassified Lysobacter TaxID=2635362 RepID=UPI001BE541D3|nr:MULTISPECIES: LysM peptidoglycan-binding domain-containing protein [unclassified Lysobacter]MBT2744781.1 LysM peptidoglycan-binding domain-containing protein [Lysobacter sp. ISL-42]MBT2752226.1 LysM peptidoglycan-binding domain-containing protein [Lysobacter sp. ISL-50]MBT2778723.1 LysM peptidoglycan-binding domain-containing protein [Lysobacter sp. ISL-54]MBT2780346.1 LysM peptidoglycan-binding domain-containing protein [Lysobacter sp. ISL-52]
MTTLNGPSYSGPQMGALVNTKSEIETGQVATPAGMKPIVVQPGDNLTQIAAANGVSLEQLLAANPQFSQDPASNPGTRNPDLVYPGEVVFAPGPESKATATAAANYEAALADDKTPNTSGQDARDKAEATSSTRHEFSEAVQAEIDSSMTYSGNSREAYGKEAVALGEQIAQRYEAQGKPELAKVAREAAQQRSNEINNEV